MNDDILIIQLRDCFTAGYTLPQFCVDNGIKKPLFVAINESQLSFVWTIYVQFKYDKRIQPEFSFTHIDVKPLNLSVYDILQNLECKKLSDITATDCDRIICLSSQRFNIKSNAVVYLDELLNLFIRRVYAEIPISNFMQNHNGVKLIMTNFPIQEKHDDIEFEQRLWSIAKLKEVTSSSNSDVETLLDRFGYTHQEIFDITEAPVVKQNPDGSTCMSDSDNPLVNIHNGKRMTFGQPDDYANKIFFVGSCHHYGVHAPWNKTIASYLQQYLNKHKLPYRVENESQRFFGRQQDIFYTLNNLKPKAGDIIFIWLNNLILPNIPFFDISCAFDPPVDYRDIFVTRGHVNEIGYEIVAKKFFELLVSNNFFRDIEFKYPAPPPPPPHRYGIPKENFVDNVNLTNNKELDDYKRQLRGKRLQIGSIVMNCNPFTLGHEYLIEYAAARVSKLYVFVVEEDRSDFKFADRLRLVQEGVKQFPNVEVIPSGKFIISQQTFSGYFNKSELQDVAVDSSEDIEIFAREIAPMLGINIRFVGEEPEDTVTRQYNDNMRAILPRYGIDFCEIPRREINGEVISAKLVRAALKVGDFDKIQTLVPKTTLDFLRSIPPPSLKNR